MSITILYMRRPDGSYVIDHLGNPYHVIDSDPLFAECEATYGSDASYPDEPQPKEPEVFTFAEPADRLAELEARIAALEAGA